MEFKTIGLVEQNIMEFLAETTPESNHERLKEFLKEYNITNDMIEKMLIHENDEERLFTLTIKGYEEELYHRVKKGVADE